MTKILKISNDIKISQDNLNIKNLIIKRFHASGESLIINIDDYVSQPCMLLITGSGNNNHYLGVINSSSIIKISSNGTYDSAISVSDWVITMPTSGYYYWGLF